MIGARVMFYIYKQVKIVIVLLELSSFIILVLTYNVLKYNVTVQLYLIKLHRVKIDAPSTQ